MNTSKACFFFVIIMFLFLAFPTWGAKDTIRVGIYDNPPKIYLDKNRKPAGLFPDLLKEIQDKENWEIHYVEGTWKECLERLSRDEIDILPDIAFSTEREKQFRFSKEDIFINWGGLFYKKEANINSLSELQGKKIAVMKGCIHTEGENGIKAILKQKNLEATIIEVDSYLEALKTVRDGKADVAAVNQLLGQRHKKEFDLITSSTVFNPIELKFASSQTNAKSIDLLKSIDFHIKAMKSDSSYLYNNSFQNIATKHLNSWAPHKKSYKPTLNFSQLEMKFIKETPQIMVAIDPNLPPIEFIGKNGDAKGITSDLLKLISKRSGLNFTYVESKSWSDNLQQINNGNVDLIPFIIPTNERAKHLRFTKPYQRFPALIFARSDHHYLANLNQLKNKKVCVIKGYAMMQILREHDLLGTVIEVKNIEEALLALESGEADIYIGFILPTTHAMQKLGLTNLKVIGETPIDAEFSMAVRKELRLLQSILNKSLASINEEEWNQMYQKWNTVTINHGFDYKTMWRIVLVSLLIISIFILWNRSLAKEIARRKEVEAKLKEQTTYKNSLVQMVVHDMRSPLQIITSYIDILRMENDPSKFNFDDTIDAISRNTHTLIQLVSDVIDTQKMEEMGMNLLKEDINIFPVIEETFTKMSILRKDVKCSLLLPELPQLAHCDISIITRVIQNLLSNSLKYTNSHVALSVIDEEQKLRIEVLDDGPGIPPEYHEKVFEKFGQVHSQKKEHSTGLGLTFCKMAVEEHGGEIGVISKSGKGSCFWFTLPKKTLKN